MLDQKRRKNKKHPVTRQLIDKKAIYGVYL